MSKGKGPGARLLSNWQRARRLPFGDQLFTWALGNMVPYTASIAPRVLELQPGLARVAMSDEDDVLKVPMQTLRLDRKHHPFF